MRRPLMLRVFVCVTDGNFGMPTFGYLRYLVGFAIFQEHILPSCPLADAHFHLQSQGGRLPRIPDFTSRACIHASRLPALSICRTYLPQTCIRNVTFPHGIPSLGFQKTSAQSNPLVPNLMTLLRRNGLD
ncbi:hypothetical protein QBC35DRAFT_215307 [Podospora australis]|uniref:Uncharacterized protein n=1 Tax=Podospora australis TaxID=1536484 RepID=A0AAN7AJJ8_9PEZI|nr:hypothetical protein QBC35DRAFT_215307 [Podospora australis]